MTHDVHGSRRVDGAAGLRAAQLSVPRNEPDRRGVHARARAHGAGREGRAPAALGAARRAAGVPAAAARAGRARGEVRTLRAAEWQGGRRCCRASALLCGFYLNELLLQLLPRDDPHEALFDDYAEAVARARAGATRRRRCCARSNAAAARSSATRWRSSARRRAARRSSPSGSTVTIPSAGPVQVGERGRTGRGAGRYRAGAARHRARRLSAPADAQRRRSS